MAAFLSAQRNTASGLIRLSDLGRMSVMTAGRISSVPAGMRPLGPFSEDFDFASFVETGEIDRRRGNLANGVCGLGPGVRAMSTDIIPEFTRFGHFHAFMIHASSLSWKS